MTDLIAHQITSPFNASTGNEYQGGNIEKLEDANYASAKWATYKQWLDLGFQVNKGQKSTKILRFGSDKKANKKTGEKAKKSFMKAFSVFNEEQVSAIEAA